MIENIIMGFGQFADPLVLLTLFCGVALGLTVGALPGLNDSITIAVLIPVTFGMKPTIAMALLVGIYVASACGGSLPAGLLEIPGTAAAVAKRAWPAGPECMYDKLGIRWDHKRSGADVPVAGPGNLCFEIRSAGVLYAGDAWYCNSHWNGG